MLHAAQTEQASFTSKFSYISNICDTGSLERLLPEAGERSRVLAMVAQECQATGQVDWAIELFQASGQAASALHIVCHQLAMLIPSSLDHKSDRTGASLPSCWSVCLSVTEDGIGACCRGNVLSWCNGWTQHVESAHPELLSHCHPDFQGIFN